MFDPSNNPRPARDAALDGLRGVAISLVLWRHLLAAYLPAGHDSWLGWLKAATNLSWCGVDLFFVLSGYFIGGILMDQRDAPRLARTFYLRRAVRILPLYYVTLGATFLVIALRALGAYHEFAPWVYATFLTNFALAGTQTWDWLPLSVLWSLAVEEQFYLLAPWIVRAISASNLPWMLFALAVGAEAGRMIILLAFPDGHFAAHVLTPFRMDGLALGALVAWSVRQPTAKPFYARLARNWERVLATGAIALATLSLLRPADGSPMLCLAGYGTLAVVFSMTLAVVVGVRPSALNAPLCARPLVHLGRHSYFVYLWHSLIGGGVIAMLGGPHFSLNSLPALGAVVLAVAATWGAAVLSWRFFEGPLVELGHRQAY